jgi:3-polyprenyl-4-hydroxybenzoate decarboxylase
MSRLVLIIVLGLFGCKKQNMSGCWLVSNLELNNHVAYTDEKIQITNDSIFPIWNTRYTLKKDTIFFERSKSYAKLTISKNTMLWYFNDSNKVVLNRCAH